MLKDLLIQNLVLMESCSIELDPKLSVITGETARLIGEKLKNLSSHRQIICITHFPQVACSTHLHLSVQKQTDRDRTQAKVQRLDSSLRENELLRMLGGKQGSEH